MTDFDHGFGRACPSGNHMLEGNPKTPPVFPEDDEDPAVLALKQMLTIIEGHTATLTGMLECMKNIKARLEALEEKVGL